MDTDNSDMTLAFELAAAKQLASPKTAIEDAQTWSKYLGIVSDRPTYVVTNYARKHQVDQDFFSGPRDKYESLSNIKSQFGSDRYVFLGTDPEDQDDIESIGWEFLSIEEAADAAGWKLTEEETNGSTDRTVEHSDWP